MLSDTNESTFEGEILSGPLLRKRRNIKLFYKMETFIASRLAIGNRFFRSKIIVDEFWVTMKDPGLFSGKEITIPYTRMSSVDIACPFAGFSTISIETTGDGKMTAHSFTAHSVKRMKELILDRIEIARK